MISYIIFYYQIVFFSYILIYLNNKKIKLLSLIIIGYILILYAGFRIPSGGDWYNYRDIFIKISSYDEIFSYNIYAKEPLYLLLNLFIKEFSENYYLLFIIISFLSISINFYSYKKYTPYFLLSIILYMSFFYYFRELGAIRAGLAYAIFLFSIQYILKRNIIKFFLLNLIAIGFHYTAILGLIIYPLYTYINWNKTKLFILLFASILIYILHMPNMIINAIVSVTSNNSFIIFQKIANYQKDSSLVYQLGLFNITNIKNILISIFFIYNYNSIKLKNSYFTIILLVFIIGTFFRILFSDFGVLAARSATLFNSVEVILLTYTLYLFKQKNIIIFLLVLYGSLQLYISFTMYEINTFKNYIFN